MKNHLWLKQIKKINQNAEDKVGTSFFYYFPTKPATPIPKYCCRRTIDFYFERDLI